MAAKQIIRIEKPRADKDTFGRRTKESPADRSVRLSSMYMSVIMSEK